MLDQTLFELAVAGVEGPRDELVAIALKLDDVAVWIGQGNVPVVAQTTTA